MLAGLRTAATTFSPSESALRVSSRPRPVLAPEMSQMRGVVDVILGVVVVLVCRWCFGEVFVWMWRSASWVCCTWIEMMRKNELLEPKKVFILIHLSLQSIEVFPDRN